MNTLKVMALLTQPFVLFQIAPNEFRPALVVRAWSNQSANLLVFADGSNDGLKVDYTMNTGDSREAQNGLNNGKYPGVWRTSVCHGTGVGQWLHPWEVEVDETGLCQPCHYQGMQVAESCSAPLKPWPEVAHTQQLPTVDGNEYPHHHEIQYGTLTDPNITGAGCTKAPGETCTGCDPSGTSCGETPAKQCTDCGSECGEMTANVCSQAAGAIKTE